MTALIVGVVLALMIVVIWFVAQQQSSQSKAGEKWVERGGQFQRADEAFDAWTGGDLPEMLAALKKPTNPVDRHFLLLGIVEATYRERKDPKKRALFLEIAQQHVDEFPSLAGPLRKDFDGELPHVPTFQKLATVLADDGRFDDAVTVCEQAIALDLHDGTKSGFEGRIERIRKKQKGAQHV